LSATRIKAGIAILAATSVAALGAAPAFGASAGDFDNNGVEDLAVGAPGEDVGPRNGPEVRNAGAVDVFYGQSAGLSNSGNQYWTQNSPGVNDAAEPGDRFGSSVATGDVNGDGFDDLIVGVPFEDIGAAPKTDAGAVQVLFGSPTGLVAAGNKFISIDPEDGDHFGTAVAAADMFAGPEADLAVGGPGEDGKKGRVNRFAGPGLAPFGTVQNGSAAGDLAGSALATGQFGTTPGTGLSGKADLAVGAPGAMSGAGSVRVYRFGNIGSAFSQTLDESNLSRTIEPGDHFGAALAAGNFGDGSLDDLAVGAPQEDIETKPATDAGIVGVFYGRNGTLSTAGTDVWDQENAALGTIETGDQFGAALAAGNFGKTSVDDLAIGTPTEDIGSGPSAQVDAGAVGFLYGDVTNGLTNVGAESRVPQPNFNYGPPDGGELGASLAAGNFGSGTRKDIAAGIPLFPQFAGDPANSATGLVGVLYGRADGISSGVSSPDLTLLNQFQVTGLGDDREGGDIFGAALAPSAGGSIIPPP
jgi:hypothetical protein